MRVKLKNGSVDLCGYQVSIDSAEATGPCRVGPEEFEEYYGVAPGDRYEINDTYDKELVGNYVYLGHGWSLCECSGGMYILPSDHPHYYTKGVAIRNDIVKAAIELVASAAYEDYPFDMDA